MSTENTTVATPAEPKGDVKTFSQEDVNRIVQERLAKDRAKASEEMSKKEQELIDREFRLNIKQKVIERGYSENILDALNCSNEDAFNKALDTLDSLMKERGLSDSDIKARQNAAVFTAPIQSSGFRDGPDPIRKAMGLRGE